MPPPPGPGGMRLPPPMGMGMPPGPGMMMGGGVRPGGPKKLGPTKPVIKPVKKLINFNWRRIFVAPTGTADKKGSIWDDIKELEVKQDEIEDLFENKVIN